MTPSPAFALAHLSLLDAAPEAFARLAAEAGFRAIGLRIQSAGPGTLAYPLAAGSAELAALRAVLDGEGVAVADVEMVPIGADLDVAALRPMFEAAAELGAERLNCAGDDPDRARLTDRFAAIAALAAEHRMTVDLEFMRWRAVATLADAVAVVEASGAANVGVLVDALHLFRSGGTVAEVAAVAGRVANLQLCDAGLAHPADGDYLAEARNHRLPPGAGDLPLIELLGAISPRAGLSIEVPCPKDLRNRPVEHLIALRRAAEDLLRRRPTGQPGRAGA